MYLWLFGVLFVYLAGCDNNNDVTPPTIDERVLEFIESVDFKQNVILNNKTVDYTKSHVSYENNNVSMPVITICLRYKGEIVGSVEAIRLTNENLKLPNGRQYFMLYRDLRQFNFTTATGSVKLLDMNYDNFNFGILEYKEGANVSAFFQKIPEHIKYKYQRELANNVKYFKLRNRTTSKTTSTCTFNGLPCDYDKDGNIGYGECYYCFNQACSGDTTCYTSCYGLGDAFLWVLRKFPHCQASIGVACIWISMNY